MNGEFIFDPEGQPGRFDQLHPGNLAVFGFTGRSAPEAITMVFLAATAPSDATLHSALSSLILGGRRTMIVPTADQIAPALRKPGVPADHPLEVLAVDSAVEFALEDVVQKGMAGVVALRRRRAARPITALELDQAQRAMERTGREGEALVNARLMTTQNPGGNFAFAWEASENAVASYDFRCISEGGIMGDGQMKIDVKSTRGPFSTNFHLSLAEAIDAATSETPYHIWRISRLLDDAADIHKSEDIREFASGLVTAHNGAMPGNVQADSFSIPVDTPGLIWGAVERLDRLDPDEDL